MMRIIVANNFYKKLMGFMFKTNINYGIFFPKVNKIHTFFMRFNIDIYGLDNNNFIVSSKLNVKPNRVIILSNACSTLEIPSNLNKIFKIGDKVNL